MGNVFISFCGFWIRLRTKQDHSIKDKKKKKARKKNRGVAHPSLFLSWLLTGSVESLWGMFFFCAPWAWHRHPCYCFALYWMQRARYSVEPWSWALLVSTGVHATSQSQGLQGKVQGKGRASVQGVPFAAVVSHWCSANRNSPLAVGCPHVLPSKKNV